MESTALVIIAIMSTISGIAAIAVLVDMYSNRNHKANMV
ncbi:hypothetical protein SAMN06298211_10896 [Prevotellaceae bacterium MN60]|nr:hypothetical protein SAMN06298211_10896 [Prevotellaceae bacterium MN60]